MQEQSVDKNPSAFWIQLDQIEHVPVQVLAVVLVVVVEVVEGLIVVVVLVVVIDLAVVGIFVVVVVVVVVAARLAFSFVHAIWPPKECLYQCCK